MTKVQGKGEVIDIKALLAGDAEFLRAAVRSAIEAALEAEMTETLGAAKGERTETRLGSRWLLPPFSDHPHWHARASCPAGPRGRFSTELFERYQRSGEGFDECSGGNECPGRLDPKGQGGDGDAVWP
jgi:transposase-like protein